MFISLLNQRSPFERDCAAFLALSGGRNPRNAGIPRTRQAISFVVKLIIAIYVIALMSAANRASASTIPGVPGSAILARSSGDALIIWNATPLVTTIAQDHVADAAANDQIARLALKILAQMQQLTTPAAQSITVRVVYEKTGSVSPTYGTATFDGLEQYEELTAKANVVSGDAGHWRELASHAPVPAWLHVKILGSLPPR